MTADKRLRDDRVKATRKPVWENQWDGDRLRPGWVERLAPTDPAPEYSRLDVLDGLPRPVRVDSLPIPGRVVERHTGFGVRMVAVAVLVTVCAVIALAAVGLAHLAGWAA